MRNIFGIKILLVCVFIFGCNAKKDINKEMGYTVVESKIDKRKYKDNGRQYYAVTVGLHGDQNIADVAFTVLFKIKDAGNFLFKLRNPELTVKDMAESVVREVVGQRDLQFLLTEGRQEVEQVVRNGLQEVLDGYESGVLIQSVQLQSVDPPSQVIDAFDEVQRARQDKERLVNEANTYLNRIVPNARGEAAKLIESARAYKEQVVKQAEGVAQNFIDVYNSYKDAKEVTRRRIYLETLREVLEGKNKIILDDAGGQGVVPYLPLNELKKGNNN